MVFINPIPRLMPSQSWLDSLVSNLLARYLHIDIPFSLVILIAITVMLNYYGIIFLDFVKDYLMSTAEIRPDDEMYNYVMFWVST